jgi:hypothetical protein
MGWRRDLKSRNGNSQGCLARLPPQEIGYKDVSGDGAAQLWARQMKGVGAVFLYGVVALLMGFINKVISHMYA